MPGIASKANTPLVRYCPHCFGAVLYGGYHTCTAGPLMHTRKRVSWAELVDEAELDRLVAKVNAAYEKDRT